MRNLIVLLLAIILGFGVWYVRYYHAPRFVSLDTPSPSPTGIYQNDRTKIIAENLDTPWAIAFLPTGEILVTERPGRVRLITKNSLSLTPVLTVPNIVEIGEGGLLGVAISPKFSENHFVYLYYTYKSSGATLYNRIVQMTYENSMLSQEKVLIDSIPSSSNHDGGRLKFGPDGDLYATTGDAESPSQAQDKTTLNGKILRMATDGKPALGNPYGTLVYSYGHRNPQGIAWDSTGNLWATEHGRSGVTAGFDELNLIRSGYNYGWPIIQGDQSRTGMEAPASNSGSSITWAPSGVAYSNGSLYFGGLKGQALYEAVLDGTSIKEVKPHLQNEFGRIRDVVLGPDAMLYITTSNNDSRGIPVRGDDKIIMINPQKL